jgi:hypothetical protein
LETVKSSGKQRTAKKGTGRDYRITVRSELSRRYAAAFEGIVMETETGRTVLIGEGLDQPHLHGILDRINALGLELLSVESSYPEKKPKGEGSAGGGAAAPSPARSHSLP